MSQVDRNARCPSSKTPPERMYSSIGESAWLSGIPLSSFMQTSCSCLLSISSCISCCTVQSSPPRIKTTLNNLCLLFLLLYQSQTFGCLMQFKDRIRSRKNGILLPNNQRQHRTSHAPEDVLPLRIYADYCAFVRQFKFLVTLLLSQSQTFE